MTAESVSRAAEPPVRVAAPAPFGVADLTAWLAGYGVELRDVRRLEIVTSSRVPRDVADQADATTWLRIDKIRRGDDGMPFAVFEAGAHRLATELLLIPIHDLPRPVGQQRTDVGWWTCAVGGERQGPKMTRHYLGPASSVDGPVCDLHAVKHGRRSAS